MGGYQAADNALGALIGGAFQTGGTRLQYKFNKKMQKDAQKFAIHMAKHRHVYMMQDLAEAGLNPILAAMGGLSGSSPGPGIGSGVSAPDLASSARQGALIASELRNVEADTKLKRSAGNKAAKEADLVDVQRQLLDNTFIPKMNQAHSEAKTAYNTERETAARADLAALLLPQARSSAKAQSSGIGARSRFVGEILKNITGQGGATPFLQFFRR